MKTTFTIFITVLFSTLVYSQEYHISLNDKIVRKHFTKSDIKNLNLILDFFDDIVKKAAEENDPVEICYEKYCLMVKEISEVDSFDLKFSYKQEKQLFNKIGEVTFNKIWYYTQPYRIVNGKKISDFPETIELFYKSPFIDLCKKLSIINPKIKFYHETYREAGTMNSEMIEQVFENIDHFNFSDPLERLIIAVHFLTVNSRFYNE